METPCKLYVLYLCCKIDYRVIVYCLIRLIHRTLFKYLFTVRFKYIIEHEQVSSNPAFNFN